MPRTPQRLAGVTATALAAIVLASCSPGPGKFIPGECGRNRVVRTDIVALTDTGQLACIEGADTDATKVIGTLTGLESNETLVGIDYRSPFKDAGGVSNNVPVEGTLYGLGNLGGLYSINPSTAVATKKAQISVALAGTAFGIDFNPTVDRLRVVSNTGQNLRVNVDTGAALVDGGLVSGGTTATGVAAAAYTNVDSDPATGTTLFDIDVNSDQLLVQNPPNDGVLVGIGAPLGIDATGPVGFDLYSSVKDIGGGVLTTTDLAGYATVATAAGRSLYQVTPFSGRLVNLGDLGLPVRDIAIPLAQ
ncbi:MAG TPA: DUF4394 domain-containing protein [Microthrixaceae bacterium]|nr:DUF4394 domain-containing protein [Microthrixaceae bacterium]